MDKSTNERFNYTYSAPTAEERREIDGIRKQYLPEEEDKLGRLRALDRRVNRPPACIALILGVIGCLTFGLGMTMVLEWGLAIGGSVTAAAGAAVMAAAYPLHRFLLKRNKERYRGEVLRLSDELLHENER